MWRAGPLTKGPGLCHGTAGNGYALLVLHHRTGDPIWLERARVFAAHAVHQVRGRRAEHGQVRGSLFTGDVGVACFLGSILDRDPRWPLLDVA